MSLTNAMVQQRVQEKFGEAVSHFSDSYGMLNFEIEPAQNIRLLQFLYQDELLHFQFLTALCGVHFPNQKGRELGVVYHLHNLRDNVRIRFKIFVDSNQPEVFTATQLFEAANWLERETYDFYGIHFIGHPNLTRILNADEMTYFPMRKQYPMEDQTRTDKDDEMFGRGGHISNTTTY